MNKYILFTDFQLEKSFIIQALTR